MRAAVAAAALGIVAAIVVGSASTVPPATATPSPGSAAPSPSPSEAAVEPSTPSPSPSARVAPVRAPSIAPEGRTGDPALDALIDQLLNADAAALATVYPDLPARREVCDPGCERVVIPPDVWSSWLAAAKRSLYAVYVGDPADAVLLFAVGGGDRAREAWEFYVLDGKVGEIDISTMPPSAADAPLHVVTGMPSPARDYELFYVLPPRDQLPQAPRVHALATRTGDAGVDALLATFDQRDAAGIQAALSDPSALLVRECQGEEAIKDAAFARGWSQQMREQVYGIHSVVRLPEGYQPRGGHLLVLYRQLKPYWWEPLGVLEGQGKVLGILTSDGGCSPRGMYPPARYVVPPPEGGLAGLDPSRRSGIAVIDAVLEAIQKRDKATLAGLISYRKVACGDEPDAPPGAGPPPCPTGAPPGTLVDVLPEVVCHYSDVMSEHAPTAIIEFVAGSAPFGLYAVVEGVDDAATDRSVWHVVTASQRGFGVALTVTERGVAGLYAGCGPFHPEALMGGSAPSFLLPPP